MPRLETVGRENIDTTEYEPIEVPIAVRRIADGEVIEEVFAFRGKRTSGDSLMWEDSLPVGSNYTYADVLRYLKQMACPGEYERFSEFVNAGGVEIERQTIADMQQALAAEYARNRPTRQQPRRSSSGGRSAAKGTSRAGSGGKGSTSTPSRQK